MRWWIGAAVAGSLLASAGGATPARSDPQSDAYAWLQYGADGHPHARVIPSDRADCPALTADERGVAMTVKAIASAGFDRVLCDAALPLQARAIRIGTQTLPPLPRRISRLVVLGDTGCRIAAGDIQNCNDGAAWPFARIAQSIAREMPRPDLIIHVGDYEYREAPCPAGDRRCAGSPFGDNWTTWAVDFFEPGAPLFTTAPLVWVRGSREACARAGLGWSRYLAPEPDVECRAQEPPFVATFDDLRIVDLDSASGAEANAHPVAFERDERSTDAAASGRETFLVTHRPPTAYFAAHAAADPEGAHPAILAGHVQLIVGTGVTLAATAEARFGYAVFDRVRGGWSIGERDPDGSEHGRCELRGREVHCSHGG